MWKQGWEELLYDEPWNMTYDTKDSPKKESGLGNKYSK